MTMIEKGKDEDRDKDKNGGKKSFFSGNFDPQKIEEKVLEFWEKNKIFEKSLEKTKNGKPFTFYDGPPFATGLPHHGHILASTIKDLISRYQTMKGRFVRRRWGWDCHGLPIEEIVERKLGISGKKQIEQIGIKKFNETCRSMVLEYAGEWGKTVRRIARWVEFDNSYKTMDRGYMESVWWAFKEIYDKGLVYEGRKVLLYCPRCETPISNFEVAMDNSYEVVKEEAVTVKFLISNSQFLNKLKISNDKPTYLLSWTTTPWTLPGNVALAVGEDISYAAVRIDGVKELLILAADRLNEVLKGHTVEVVHENIKGKDLVGLSYEPLFDVPAVRSDKTFRVYPADFVNTEEGTGVVHTAVVYGEEDYELGLKAGLPVVPLLDEKGKFNDKAPELLRGMCFKDSEEIIKNDLEKRGLLFDRHPHEHSYPHCWRCGSMLFYNAIPAWFINVQKIKKDLLKSNDKEINWFPAHLKHGRYEKSVEQAPDWNISRNRYWGNPIPIWKCEKCGEKTAIGRIGDLKERAAVKSKFYFLRHGESDNVVKELCGSSKDTPEFTYHLTEKGKKQAEEIARKLAKEKIDIIISSPLARTRETSEIITRITGAKLEFRNDLVDINPGIFNGKPASEQSAFWGEDRMKKFETPSPEGESRNDAKRRILKAFDEINQKYSGKKILIVSHGDPLWMLKGGLENKSNEEILKMEYPEVGKLYEIDARPLPIDDNGNVDLHRPYIDEIVLKCGKCGGGARRITEIFDSWFEAGSMPFSEYHYPFENKKVFESRFPAQFVAEYIAQTRAWFYVMHVISLVLFGRAPFENVVTTGTILAEDGSKMSKSKNNFPDPLEVIDKYGSDSLRFYLMNSVVMQADNLNFNVRDLGNLYRRVILILWNVYRYFETYIGERAKGSAEGGSASGGKEQRAKSGEILDDWIVARTQELIGGVTECLDEYDTVKAARVIAEYIDDLSTWYLRRNRRRRDSAFFETLYDCLLTTSKIIAPFMPYLGEIIYLNLTGLFGAGNPAESVHLADWPEARKLNQEENKLLEEMAAVREAASIGLAARKELDIPVRQPLARLAVTVKTSDVRLGEDFLDVLISELNVKKIDAALAEEKGENIKTYPGMKYIQNIYLDVEITEQLELEGLVRNLERFVQEMRKKSGLKVGEMAELLYESSDGKILKALEIFDRKKTYVERIKRGAGANVSETFESGGRKAVLGINRT